MFHAPAREDEVPAEAGEDHGGERSAARGQESASQQRRGDERDGARERRRKADSEHRRAPQPEDGAVSLEVQDADAAVGLRDAEGRGADRVGEIRRRAAQGERRPDERDVVDPKRLGNRIERGEPQRGAGHDRGRGQGAERPRGQRQRTQRLARGGNPAPEDERSGRGASGEHREHEDDEPEKQARDGPGGIGVGQERRADPADGVDTDDEGRRGGPGEAPCGRPLRVAPATRSFRREDARPRVAHFWKNRKRLTAEGPREKKSPERSGRAQSSSETPPRSSGAGIGSPFRYVPQVERMSTRR